MGKSLHIRIADASVRIRTADRGEVRCTTRIVPIKSTILFLYDDLDL